jgi:peptidoglycan hydrolase-like protein with peptidoglycan-binding domain
MMKLRHVALAGITAIAFGQPALAGEGMHQKQSGAQGEQTIRQAQEQLSSKGHAVQADGKLGPKTQAAVKEFQQSEGIQASGRLDQETLAALGVSEGSAGAGASSAPVSTPESSSPASSPEGTTEPQS